MNKKIDLTGQKIGKWEVIERAEKPQDSKKNRSYWLCKCECGTIKVVDMTTLRKKNNENISCGLCYKKLIDLKGMKFERWLVIEEVSRPESLKGEESHFWLCQCDCGSKKIVNGDSLRSGRSKSCGCLKREVAREKRTPSLVGERFGRLVVIEEAEKNYAKKGESIWKCLCDCGNEKIIGRKALINGNTLSCGCYNKETIAQIGHYNSIDITGQKFNMLTALEFVRYRRGGSVWLFQCDCGNIKEINATHVKSGHTKSCGCLKLKKWGTKKLKEYGYVSAWFTYSNYRRAALNRGYEFEITFDQFKILTSENCYYCNAKPSNLTKSINDNGDFIYNGIDRTDNRKGYLIDNVVPCCFKCNGGKRTMTETEFLNWIKNVYNFAIIEKRLGE